jgi:hypothetical protein
MAVSIFFSSNYGKFCVYFFLKKQPSVQFTMDFFFCHQRAKIHPPFPPLPQNFFFLKKKIEKEKSSGTGAGCLFTQGHNNN